MSSDPRISAQTTVTALRRELLATLTTHGNLDPSENAASSLPGIVIGLDTHIRLRRETSRKSSMYQRTESRLDGCSARQLQVLEALLYAESLGLDCCQNNDDFQPIGHFDCSVGTIWFFFSRSGRYFTLLGFELANGGGEHVPVNGAEPCPAGGSFQKIAAAGRRKIAAVAIGAAALRDSLVARSAAVVTKGSRFLSVSAYDAGLGWFSDRHSRQFRADEEIKTILARLEKTRPTHPVELPDWSILSKLVLAPQQLENDFARSIVAGELICRCVEMIAGPVVEISDRNEHGRLLNRWKLDLYRDMAKGTFASGYLTAVHIRSLTDPDIEPYALALATRSHLALLMASSLIRARRRFSDSGRNESATDVLGRFASFAEFVALSGTLIERVKNGDEQATRHAHEDLSHNAIEAFMQLRERCKIEADIRLTHTIWYDRCASFRMLRLSDALREVDARISFESCAETTDAAAPDRLTSLATRILARPHAPDGFN